MVKFKKRSSFKIFKSVILALMIREVKTRFIQNQFSYLWVVLEPVSHIVILSLIFSAFNPTGMIQGIPLPMFLMTGILPWMMFTNIVNKGMNAIEGNTGLFVYKNVKPIDTIISRTLIETIVFTLSFIVLMFIGYLIGYDISIKNFQLMFISISTIVLFGFSLGLLFASISVVFTDLKKILPMIMKPLYFISGIFYTVSVIPEEYREYNLYNPFLNSIESFRFAIFENIDQAYGSLLYVVFISLIITFFSLVFYLKNEKRMIMSR